MSKRMTVNEIDKFIRKLESTEYIDDRCDYYKSQAIVYLSNLCTQLEQKEMNSIKIRDAE